MGRRVLYYWGPAGCIPIIIIITPSPSAFPTLPSLAALEITPRYLSHHVVAVAVVVVMVVVVLMMSQLG